MARDTLGLFGCAVLILGGAALLFAGPEDNSDKLTNTLRVQNALGKGRDSLKSGHYREAVDTLEKEYFKRGHDRSSVGSDKYDPNEGL